ncbi:MAG: UbiA family prenyltransferase [Candidatus Nanopelagicales bacterium]|nr:UbiA family prenyltransferase [Candidatus Nanopelagicales bacterium]
MSLGLLRACHPLPTAAMTLVITAYAWSVGWRGAPLVGVLAAVLLGQLSVGWSNDAFDSALDRRVGRLDKPTVQGAVQARKLWGCAVAALAASVVVSWWIAGWQRGSFHVLAVLMAWLYNTVLSRTPWSWLPYAVAFAALPPFLSLGLDGTWPPAWTLVLFPIVGVSAHLANALPDIDSDRAAGVDGLAIRLGARRSAGLCWMLLLLGSGILVIVAWPQSRALSAVVVAGCVAAALLARRRAVRTAVFQGLVVAVIVDVVVIDVLTVIGA